MIDKYKEITIFEVENGWILKVLNPENPCLINQVSYISTFYSDNKSLIEGIKEIII